MDGFGQPMGVARALSNVGGGPDYGANKGTLIMTHGPAPGLAFTLSARDEKGVSSSVDQVSLIYGIQDARPLARKMQNGSGFRQADVAYTLDGLNTQAVAYGPGIRRLTPLECERLQGFPDGWTCLCQSLDSWTADPGRAMAACTCSAGPRWRALGNAVTTTVVQAFAENILKIV